MNAVLLAAMTIGFPAPALPQQPVEQPPSTIRTELSQFSGALLMIEHNNPVGNLSVHLTWLMGNRWRARGFEEQGYDAEICRTRAALQAWGALSAAVDGTAGATSGLEKCIGEQAFRMGVMPELPSFFWGLDTVDLDAMRKLDYMPRPTPWRPVVLK